MSEEVQVEQQPPVETATEETPPVDLATALEGDDDAVLDAALEAHAVEAGEKLVPLSAVTTARGKLKEAKTKLKEAEQKAAKVGELEAVLTEAAPYINAAKALVAQQHQQPQQQAQPPQEDTSALEDMARTLDLYKADGAPDIDRARKIQAFTTQHAKQIAEETIAPLRNDTLMERARANLNAGFAQTHPATGKKVDPEKLRTLYNRLASQPNGLQTLANPQTAQFVWNQAYVDSETAPQQQTQQLPAPVFTEKSGGKLETAVTLNEGDRRMARELGLTDAQYAKTLEARPWRR